MIVVKLKLVSQILLYIVTLDKCVTDSCDPEAGAHCNNNACTDMIAVMPIKVVNSILL